MKRNKNRFTSDSDYQDCRCEGLEQDLDTLLMLVTLCKVNGLQPVVVFTVSIHAMSQEN